MYKIILFILFLSFSLYGNIGVKKRIFILHSYSQEYGWTKSQNDGFVSKLKEESLVPLEISTEYLDTKRLEFSPDYQTFFLNYLETKYKDYSFDTVYVTDDNGLQFILNHKSALYEKIPIFFSGINDKSLVHTLDPLKYAGVYETKEIIPNIELIRQFSPQTRDIWIVGDDSTTYKAIVADIRQNLYLYPKYSFHFVASSKIHNIVAKLPNQHKTFVLLTTIGGLNDDDGHNLTLKESIEHLRQNPNLILCSMEDAYILEGVIGGFVTSGKSQGEHAADLVVRYLKGEPLKTIRSVVKSPNVYMFDHKALLDSRIILSEYTAHNAIILNKEKTFFERYQEIIVDTLFILSVLSVIFVLIFILIVIQKNREIRRLKRDFDECSSQLPMTKKILDACDGKNV